MRSLQNNMMKNRSMFEQDFLPKGMTQSGYVSQFISQRASNPPREYSVDKNFRRISPVPQERFSHLPGQLHYPLPPYTPNDYQLPPRANDFYLPNDIKPLPNDSKIIQELIMRIEKLEGRLEKAQKLEGRMDRLQGGMSKIEIRVDSVQAKREELGKGKENHIALDNKGNEQEFKNRKVEYITRDQLQKQLVVLDSAFKAHLNTFKTVLNTQMGEHNTKNKKKFIQITATQLNEKLEQFKAKISKEWEVQIQTAVRQALGRQFVGKTVMGLSRDKFVGSVVAVRMREELSVGSQGSAKEIAVLETVYYVDKNGFLLDKNMYYLLDKNGKEIRLAEDKLQMLKKQGLLASPDSRGGKSIQNKPLSAAVIK